MDIKPLKLYEVIDLKVKNMDISFLGEGSNNPSLWLVSSAQGNKLLSSQAPIKSPPPTMWLLKVSVALVTRET